MEGVWDKGSMEREAGGRTSTYRSHCEYEIRCRAKAWAEDSKPAGGESKLGDVDCVVGYVFGVKK